MAPMFIMKLLMPLTAYIIVLAFAVRTRFLILTVIAGVALSILDGQLGWHSRPVPFFWLLQLYTIAAFALLAPVFGVRARYCLSRGTSEVKRWLHWKFCASLIVTSWLMLVGGPIYSLAESFVLVWTGSIADVIWHIAIGFMISALGAVGLLASYHYSKWVARGHSGAEEVVPVVSPLA